MTRIAQSYHLWWVNITWRIDLASGGRTRMPGPVTLKQQVCLTAALKYMPGRPDFSKWLGLQNHINCAKSKLYGGLPLILGEEQEWLVCGWGSLHWPSRCWGQGGTEPQAQINAQSSQLIDSTGRLSESVGPIIRVVRTCILVRKLVNKKMSVLLESVLAFITKIKGTVRQQRPFPVE